MLVSLFPNFKNIGCSWDFLCLNWFGTHFHYAFQRSYRDYWLNQRNLLLNLYWVWIRGYFIDLTSRAQRAGSSALATFSMRVLFLHWKEVHSISDVNFQTHLIGWLELSLSFFLSIPIPPNNRLCCSVEASRRWIAILPMKFWKTRLSGCFIYRIGNKSKQKLLYVLIKICCWDDVFFLTWLNGLRSDSMFVFMLFSLSLPLSTWTWYWSKCLSIFFWFFLFFSLFYLRIRPSEPCRVPFFRLLPVSELRRLRETRNTQIKTINGCACQIQHRTHLSNKTKKNRTIPTNHRTSIGSMASPHTGTGGGGGGGGPSRFFFGTDWHATSFSRRHGRERTRIDQRRPTRSRQFG